MAGRFIAQNEEPQSVEQALASLCAPQAGLSSHQRVQMSVSQARCASKGVPSRPKLL
jgi:hypothetical protein